MPSNVDPYVILAFGGLMWTGLLIVGTILSLSERKVNQKICIMVWDIFKLVTGGLLGFLFGLSGAS